MVLKAFLIKLCSVVAIAAAVILSVYSTPIWYYIDFSWIMLFYYVLLSIVFYLAGQRTLKIENPNAFSYFFLLGTGFKLISSLGLLWVYIQENSPNNTTFVLPFLAIYVLFMVFEIYFLSKLSNTK